MRGGNPSAHGPVERAFSWTLAFVIATTPTAAIARTAVAPAARHAPEVDDADAEPDDAEPDDAEPDDTEPDTIDDDTVDDDTEPDTVDDDTDSGDTGADDDSGTEHGDTEPDTADDAASAGDGDDDASGAGDDVESDEEGIADEVSGADSDDAGASEDAGRSVSSVPERLPKLQIAAWWTLFGAFALGSTAGVFSGLAERQEDKATRLASRFDQETGAQPIYADVRGDYEDALSRGRAFANTAIALGAVAGAVAIAAITLFIVDARRGRRGGQRARLTPGGLQVHF